MRIKFKMGEFEVKKKKKIVIQKIFGFFLG